MGKYKEAWILSVAVICNSPATRANDTARDVSVSTTNSAPSLLLVSQGKSVGQASLDIQFRDGCDYVFANDCKGERKRLEFETSGSPHGYSTFGYETFSDTARDSFLNKAVSSPAGRAGIQAEWTERVSGWMASYNKYLTFSDKVTLDFGLAGGKISYGAGVDGGASAHLNSSIYQINSFTIPARTFSYLAGIPPLSTTFSTETVTTTSSQLSLFGHTINIPAISFVTPTINLNSPSIKTPPLSLAGETLSWPNSEISFHGRDFISISGGSITTPSITASNGQAHISSIVIPKIQITIPSENFDFQRAASISGQSGFGELRAAGAFDQSLGSHVRLTANPFAAIDTKAVYGAGIGIIFGTSNLKDSTANPDGYKNLNFIPAHGLAISFSFYDQKTVFDFPYYEAQKESKMIAQRANATSQKYLSQLNSFISRESTKNGINAPNSLTMTPITGAQILNSIGIESPLGTEKSLHIGFGAKLKDHLTLSISASRPIQTSAQDRILEHPQYSASAAYIF